MPLEKGSAEARGTDEAIRSWRQGDIARNIDFFVHLANPARSLTSATDGWSVAHEGESPAPVEVIESIVDGLVVLTQTCDLVRDCLERPFVEAAPLVRVDSVALREIQRLHRPRYAYVPGVASEQLVADLDRVMTVEKSIVATWDRTPGCTTDDDRRAFAEALARNRSRPAFPDDFNEFVKPLTRELQKRAGKASEPGRAVDALMEIRVDAAPSWAAAVVDLVFWFIRPEDSEIPVAHVPWDQHLEAWLARIPDSGRFRVGGVVVPLSRMTALDYRRSVPLDLDRLSGPR